MMLVAAALLERDPDPSDREIRWAISGNVCRCTGYVNIVKAVRHAARLRAEAAAAPAGEAAAATPGGAS
jgi:aerobic carbon-monoxide dehydrogenase small subunit